MARANAGLANPEPNAESPARCPGAGVTAFCCTAIRGAACNGKAGKVAEPWPYGPMAPQPHGPTAPWPHGPTGQ